MRTSANVFGDRAPGRPGAPAIPQCLLGFVGGQDLVDGSSKRAEDIDTNIEASDTFYGDVRLNNCGIDCLRNGTKARLIVQDS